jgi:hypothetical protein
MKGIKKKKKLWYIDAVKLAGEKWATRVYNWIRMPTAENAAAGADFFFLYFLQQRAVGIKEATI